MKYFRRAKERETHTYTLDPQMNVVRRAEAKQSKAYSVSPNGLEPRKEKQWRTK